MKLYLQVWEIVESIKNPEDIHAMIFREFTEFINNIVRVVCVANGISTSEQHLKGNIGNLFTELAKSFPWALAKETESNIKSRT